MIKYLTAGLLFTAFIIGAKIWFESNEPKQANQFEQQVEQQNNIVNELRSGEIAQPSFTQSSKTNATVPSKQSIDRGESSSASTVIWSASDVNDTVPEKFLRKGLNPQALQISQSALNKLTTGDEISISIPQLGQAYSMDVEQIRRYTNGDRTVKGHLKDTDLPYSVIITTGRNDSYATINTPDGAYVMEATGNEGWIMSIANLDYLIDTNLDDFQIPAINRGIN